MSSRSHIPLRSCSGCGRRAPQSELLRFVAAGSGLQLDPGTLGRKASGRGGYLHKEPGCWDAFLSRKPPLRSLRRSVDRPRREALVEQVRDVLTR